jgi:hypothetical protein
VIERKKDELLTRWASGEISAEEFVELERLLMADGGARRRLREHAVLDSVLRELPHAVPPVPNQPVRFSLGNVIGLRSALLMTGLTVVVATAALWFGNLRRDGIAKPNGSAVAVNAETLRLPTVSSMQFGSGTSKFRLDSVGSIIIEGPSDFNLIGPLRAKMTRGRIKMRVTEETGRGFVVETPFGEITDLGTEFGIDLTDNDKAGLVVFEGTVDLRVSEPKAIAAAGVQRLFGGEAVTFDRVGEVRRMTAVIAGDESTFAPVRESSPTAGEPIIVNVTDKYKAAETKKFYEIMPRGLREDALAYVDRQHEWNSRNKKSRIPKYLIGADYVKPYNDDKLQQDLQIEVTLSRPANLYVLFDARMEAPGWLKKDFRKTRDVIGMDEYRSASKSKSQQERGNGVGESVDNFFHIWVRKNIRAQKVTLGPPNPGNAHTSRSTMYGIAAVALPAGAQQSEKSDSLSSRPVDADGESKSRVGESD